MQNGQSGREIRANARRVRAALLGQGEPGIIQGRISRLRVSSGAAFADVLFNGRLWQAGALPESSRECYEFFASRSCGDYVRLSGSWGESRSGDRVFFAGGCELLAACQVPFASWQDPPSEEAARANPDYARACDPRRFALQLGRFRVLEALSAWAAREGFMRAPVPVLQPVASGAAANPFVSRLDALDRGLYLRVAHENELVRLLVSGFDSVYEMGPAFRNEGLSARHHPEFWLMEAYRIGMDWRAALDMSVGAIDAARAALGMEPMQAPRVMGIREAWGAFGGDPGMFSDPQAQARALSEAGHAPDPDPEVRAWQYLDEMLDPPMYPFALVGQPISISPLAAFDAGLGGAARFELFLDGVEIANGYEQCVDAQEQARRFAQQAERSGQAEAMALDEAYLEAMRMGMPPLGGFGIGADRLAQRLLGAPSIRSVLPFPISGG